jgi:hypothetical protein
MRFEYFLRFVIEAISLTDLARYLLGNSTFAPEGIDDGTSVLVPDIELLGRLLDLDRGVRYENFYQLAALIVCNLIILSNHFLFNDYKYVTL